MSDQGKVDIVISTKADTRGIETTTKGLSKLDTSLASILKGGLGRLSMGLLGISGAFSAARKALDAYSETQAREATMAQTLANRGFASPDNIARVRDLAKEMQNLTGIGKSDWQAAISRLFQGGANMENIGQFVEATKNLAAITGGDLQRAALVMSKAMGGNVESLREFGIQIDGTLPKAERMSQVFQQLSARGGGLLEARLQTLGGQWKAFQTNVHNAASSVGGLVSKTGILQSVLGIASDAAGWWAEQIGKLVPSTIDLGQAAASAVPSIEQLSRANEKAAKSAQAASEAARRLNALLERQKQLASDKASGEQAILQAGKGVMEARISALRQQGFVGPQDFQLFQKAGLISGPMGQMWARSRGGAVDDSWYTMLEANLNQVYAKRQREIEKQAQAEQEKLEKQTQDRLRAKRDDLLDREEKAEQRTKGAQAVADLTAKGGRLQMTAAELDQAAKEAHNAQPSASAAFGYAPSGTAMAEFDASRAEESRLKAQSQRVNDAANTKLAQAEQVKGMFPNLGTPEQEGASLAGIRAERQKFDQALAEFTNELAASRQSLKQKADAIREVNRLEDVKASIEVQTRINTEIIGRLKTLEGQLSNLRNR